MVGGARPDTPGKPAHLGGDSDDPTPEERRDRRLAEPADTTTTNVTGPEPIALVGIGCRLPGARGPAEFWRAVREGRDEVTPIPASRFDTRVYQAAAYEDGRSLLTSTHGGFLDQVESFDAEFFNISPYEAARMDPQQRIFLETAWEAVEDAGLTAERLAGTRTGVYTAHLADSYWSKLHRAGVWDVHAMIGSKIHGNMPARLAHVLDLRGPTISVDGTCSSALLALYMAVQALRLGEVEAAVVGAVNLVSGPEDSVMMCQGSLLSPTGRSRFGDAAADGFVRGEAAVTVILKPLRRALADGDRIYSLVLGASASNDGASNSQFLTPSVEGQRQNLLAAYRTAGVSPRDVDYVEAHGVGTLTGDRVELTALAEALGTGRGEDERLLVGSVKTNFGHGEAAAGLVGLVKAALALWHREIPATLNVSEPNPAVDWDGGGLSLARRLTPWPQTGRRAIAGVNSFGISGSNVHVVMAEPPQAERHRNEPLWNEPHWNESQRSNSSSGAQTMNACVLPISARAADALADLAGRHAERLTASDELSDICYTAGSRRTHHRYRAAAIGTDADSLKQQLSEIRLADVPAKPAFDRPRIVYVFPGLGAQWTGMARTLYAECLPFARALDRFDAAVLAEAGWSVIELLASADPLTDVGLAQPAVWAVECALAEVWAGWGLEPDLAIGHSMGEVAAATVSGALSPADAAAVICRRSDLMRKAAGNGAMTALQMGAAEAAALAERYDGRVSVAVHNGPTSTVLAGQTAALVEIEQELTAAGVFCRRVNADVAAHGPAMDPLLPDLRVLLSGLRPTRGRFPILSTVHGRLTMGEDFGTEHWVDNLRQPVLFDEAVNGVLADPRPVLFLEMTPHPLLAHAIQENLQHSRTPAAAIYSLCRLEPGLTGLLGALGRAYTHGADPDWAAVTGGGRLAELPGYPWRSRVFSAHDAVPNVPPALLEGGGTPRLTRAETRRRIVRKAARAQSVNNRPAVDTTTTATAPQPSAADPRRAVLEEIAALLALDPLLLDPDVPVTALGLDSVLAMELTRRIEHRHGLLLPIRALLQGSTLHEVADLAQLHAVE